MSLLPRAVARQVLVAAAPLLLLLLLLLVPCALCDSLPSCDADADSDGVRDGLDEDFCPDADADGMCDAADECPGLDDALWAATADGLRCMRYIAEPLGWHDAEAACGALASGADGATLVRLDSNEPYPDNVATVQADIVTLQRLAAAAGANVDFVQRAWIGLSDGDSEGEYTWSDAAVGVDIHGGDTSSWELYWHSNDSYGSAPDGCLLENCVATSLDTTSCCNLWTDERCDAALHYACQRYIDRDADGVQSNIDGDDWRAAVRADSDHDGVPDAIDECGGVDDALWSAYTGDPARCVLYAVELAPVFTWDAAQQACTDAGGALLSVLSEADRAFFNAKAAGFDEAFDLVADGVDRVWTGLAGFAPPANSTTATLAWTDAIDAPAPPLWEATATGNPSEGTAQCTAFDADSTSLHEWRTYDCSETVAQAYICQVYVDSDGDATVDALDDCPRIAGASADDGADSDSDGVTDCHDACPHASTDDTSPANGVCDEGELAGCTDSSACNFAHGATADDGSCWYAGALRDCACNCFDDVDIDDVCDTEEVYGCTDAAACSFDPAATELNATACHYDADNDGVCDNVDVCPGMDDSLWLPLLSSTTRCVQFRGTAATWRDAEATCVANGGHLLRVASAAENEAAAALADTGGSDSGVWIGFNQIGAAVKQHETSFVWSDHGNAAAYVNFADEPLLLDCVLQYHDAPHEWSATNCSHEHTFVCERWVDADYDQIAANVDCNDAHADDAVDGDCDGVPDASDTCPGHDDAVYAPVPHDAGRCFAVHEPSKYTDARETCTSGGGVIASVRSWTDNVWLSGIASSLGADLYIGYTDAVSSGTFVWNDAYVQANYDFTAWDVGQPEYFTTWWGIDSCGAISATGGWWYAVSCDNVRDYVCIVYVDADYDDQLDLPDDDACVCRTSETLAAGMVLPLLDDDGDSVCDCTDACAGVDDLQDVDADSRADCSGVCLFDVDHDNVCDDTEEVYGCTDAAACSFDPAATELDATTCHYDADNDGVCDNVDVCPGMDDSLWLPLPFDATRCVQYHAGANDALSWTAAEANCSRAGGSLIRMAAVENLEYVSSSMYDLGAAGFWIGYSDRATEGEWMWSDYGATDVVAWGNGEPNDYAGSEDCAVQSTTASTLLSWNDLSCDAERSFVCARYTDVDRDGLTADVDLDDSTPSTDTDTDGDGVVDALDACPGHDDALYGPIPHDTSRCYRVFDVSTSTWPEASSACESDGGTLFRINDAYDSAFLQQIQPQQNYWIGLNDVAQEGVWEWTDTIIVPMYPFLNWMSGEPNNAGSGEDYVGTSTADATWNDYPATRELSGPFSCQYYTDADFDGFADMIDICPTERSVLAVPYLWVEGLIDADGDLVCDSVDPCPYSSTTYSDSRTCDGVCLVDVDGDDICDDEGDVLFWNCNNGWYNDGSYCDCGCSEQNLDPDCVENLPLYAGSCPDDGVTYVGCDGSGACIASPSLGCMDTWACNYDATAVIEPADSCVYASFRDCDGTCFNDSNNDGVCDEEIGCMDCTACNYDPMALVDNDTCVHAVAWAHCDGSCLIGQLSGGDGACKPRLPDCSVNNGGCADRCTPDIGCVCDAPYEVLASDMMSCVIPQTCVALFPDCGDGVVNDGESCDDGNVESGDGCSSRCILECTPGTLNVTSGTCKYDCAADSSFCEYGCSDDVGCLCPPGYAVHLNGSCEHDGSLVHDGALENGERSLSKVWKPWVYNICGANCYDNYHAKWGGTYDDYPMSYHTYTEYFSSGSAVIVKPHDTSNGYATIGWHVESFSGFVDCFIASCTVENCGVYGSCYQHSGMDRPYCPFYKQSGYDDVTSHVELQCYAAVCGDGLLHDVLEECDDGNSYGGDGCSSTCTIETGFECPYIGRRCEEYFCEDCSHFCSAPPCGMCACPYGATLADSRTCEFQRCGASGTCGNCELDGGEDCDDGNTVSGDGCSSTCTLEPHAACLIPGDTCVMLGGCLNASACNYDGDAVVSLPSTCVFAATCEDCAGAPLPDTDGDGLCDDVDVCMFDVQNDIDGDGVCGDVDVCWGDDMSGDSDSDGACDSDDICAGADDFLDSDGDGVVDCLDSCPTDNPDDGDSDGACGTASATTTNPGSPVAMTLAPTDDTFASKGGDADRSFGGNKYLLVAKNRYSYVNFDVPCGDATYVHNATLYLMPYDAATEEVHTLHYIAGGGGGFDETTLTWNNPPADASYKKVGTHTPVQDVWVALNVAEALRAVAATAVDVGSTCALTFRLKGGDVDRVKYWSKEKSAELAPRLEIVTEEMVRTDYTSVVALADTMVKKQDPTLTYESLKTITVNKGGKQMYVRFEYPMPASCAVERGTATMWLHPVLVEAGVTLQQVHVVLGAGDGEFDESLALTWDEASAYVITKVGEFVPTAADQWEAMALDKVDDWLAQNCDGGAGTGWATFRVRGGESAVAKYESLNRNGGALAPQLDVGYYVRAAPVTV